jgi:hypothetical protein
MHPTQDLSGVCDALGLQPKIIWKKGDERRAPKGQKLDGIRKNSRCLIDFGPTSTESLAKQLEAALVLLRPHQILLQELSSSGGKFNFFVGLFCGENTVEVLDTKLMETMVSLRIDLILDIYSPDPPEVLLNQYVPDDREWFGFWRWNENLVGG